MERKKRQLGAARPPVVVTWAASLAVAVVGLLVGNSPAVADEPIGPAAQAEPSLMPAAVGPGADPQTAWALPPDDGGPRDGSRSSLLYDNGAPLDDWRDPASQLSNASGVWRFIAGSADDFELVDYVSPDANYQITLVRGAFMFFNVPTGQTPTPLQTWEGIDVVVYANAPLGWPNERPLQDGGHTAFNGGPVARQYVPVADLPLNETLLGTCRPCYQVDIPVNLAVAKNTKYWLSLIPRFNAPPQAAWCISSVNDLGLRARQGASFGITFWTEVLGNYGCPSGSGCPAGCTGVPNPPAGTNRDLSFQLYGWEMPPNRGACCDLVAGTCVDVTDPAQCSGTFKEYHPGVLCAYLDPPCNAPLTGACCTESTGSCVSGVRVDLCPVDSDHRFEPGLNCTQIIPPCGAGSGACCFPDRHCEDLVAAACQSLGGFWNVGNCATHTCPPPNDDCADAPVIHGDAFLFFSTVGATSDGPSVSGPDCTSVNQDIWFKYVAPCTGTAIVSLCYGTNYDSAIAVYEGCTCPANAASQVACNDDGCGGHTSASMTTVSVIAGHCYTIRIGGNGTETGEGFLLLSCLAPGRGACCLSQGGCDILDEAICTALGGTFHANQPCSPLLCPPPNDDCTNAFHIGDGMHPFATFGATTDGPPVSGAGCTDVTRDIWFDYEATCAGEVVVTLCRDTFYDAALAVYDGWSCNPPGSQVVCNNDACGPGGPARVFIPSVTTGTRFKIRVGGFADAVGPGTLIVGCLPPNDAACCLADGSCVEKTQLECEALSGTFHPGEPCSPLICPPSNDDCANAITITSGSYAFDTRGATTDGLEDSPGGYCVNVHRDIWYKYTATCNGRLVVSLCGTTDYDSAVAIYQGCATCPPTLLIGCDNDGCEAGGASVASASVTSGTCYLIRVGGAGESSGTGTLAVGCLPPNTGACCHADFTCAIALPSQCAALGDTFNLGEPCSDIICSQPAGACCFLTGGCQVQSADACAAANGNFQGNGTTCNPNPCPQPAECCVGDAYGDGVLDGQDIAAFIKLLLDPPAFGTIQFCWANVNESDWVVDLADMPPFVQRLLDAPPCGPQPTGACCLGGGSCEVLSQGLCMISDGAYQGNDTVCSPNPCPQPGACCQLDGACAVTMQVDCLPPGIWHGEWPSCDPNPCTQCEYLGDMNGDSVVDGRDVQGLVDCLLGNGTNCACGDINGVGGVEVGDIPGFVDLLVP